MHLKFSKHSGALESRHFCTCVENNICLDFDFVHREVKPFPQTKVVRKVLTLRQHG